MVAGLRAVLEEWRDHAGVYALAPPLLTAFLFVVHAVDVAGVPVQLAVNTLVTSILGGMVAPVHHLVVVPAARALGLALGPRGRLLARVVSVVVGIAIGSDLSARALVAIAVAGDLDPVRAQIARVGTVVSVAMIAVLAARTASRNREEAVRREAELARLQAAQARTDPHFLYNALNTVAALIPADPGRAEDAVLRLSDLFRYVLDGARRERVALREELAAIDDYLGLEALRLGDRLRVVRSIDPGVVEVSVLPLILQPLVENAVQHGIATQRRGGTVTIRAQAADGAVELAVEDDGPGVGVSGKAGTAHADLRRRLDLVYGDRGQLWVGPRPGGGYAARIVIPAEGP